MSDATTTTTTDTTTASTDTGAQSGDATQVQTDSTQTGQDTTQTGKAEEKPAAQADGKDQTESKGDGKDGEADKAAGAPEKYEPFKLPDGVVIDAQDSEALQAYAKENNLSQDAAQKIADLGAKQAEKFVTKLQEAQEARNTEWANAAKADKEFGGDKLVENLAVAKTFLDSFGSPELNTFLVSSGLGNHPEVIRLMVKAGKAISEDTAVQGGNPATAPTKDIATALYGNSSPK
jgi:hypothetical protein